jgi:hypothetical protein
MHAAGMYWQEVISSRFCCGRAVLDADLAVTIRITAASMVRGVSKEGEGSFKRE